LILRYAEPEEKLAVTGGADQRGADHASDAEIVVVGPGGDTGNGAGVDGGIANDATLFDLVTTGLELWFNKDEEVRAGFERTEDGGEDGGGGDEGDVHDEERRGLGERLEFAGVGALDDVDARVIAKADGDLAVADIDGGDVGGAVLEQAIGEAAGGCTNIEAAAALDGDAGALEGVDQLIAAAGDEAGGSLEGDLRVLGGGRGGAEGDLAVDEDLAGKDEGAGAFAAGREATIDEELIEATFAASFGGIGGAGDCIRGGWGHQGSSGVSPVR
jgi:hypothetical protein